MMSNRTTSRATRVIREQRTLARRRRTAIWISVSASLVLVAASLAGYAAYRAQKPADVYPVPSGATTDREGITLGSGPVEVEVFLDYQCPACRDFDTDAHDKLATYLARNRITLVLHPVAILDRYSTNRYSSRTAASAACAADSGRILEYTGALYAQQPAEGGPGHTDERLIEIGASVGLGEPFARCVRDRTYPDWVAHVTLDMAERGVTSTPTVLVNGHRLPRTDGLGLTAAVDAA